jgi:hypothetical protein
MGQHFVIILEFYFEHGVGQRFLHRRHYLNRVFLRQTASSSAGSCFPAVAPGDCPAKINFPFNFQFLALLAETESSGSALKSWKLEIRS